MFKKFTVIMIVSAVAGTAQADSQRINYETPSSSLEETAGFFSGAALGAAAGGPPGAIVGAAIGAFVGDGWNSKGQVADLRTDLYQSRLQLTALQEQLSLTQREHQLAKQELEGLKSDGPRVLSTFLDTQPDQSCCDNTVLSIHFRTGSSTIETHYEEQLESLVDIATQMPRMNLEITGYADRNGNTEKNLMLSRRRSESVKQFFRNKGIENTSITTSAYGEARPLEVNQNFETDFFDRRVVVKLQDGSKRYLTRNPDRE